MRLQSPTPLGESQNSSPSLNSILLNRSGLPSFPFWLFLAQNFSATSLERLLHACFLGHLLEPECHRAGVPSAPAAPGQWAFSESICIALPTPLKSAFHSQPSVALRSSFSKPPCPTPSQQAWVSDYFPQMKPLHFSKPNSTVFLTVMFESSKQCIFPHFTSTPILPGLTCPLGPSASPICLLSPEICQYLSPRGLDAPKWTCRFKQQHFVRG